MVALRLHHSASQLNGVVRTEVAVLMATFNRPEATKESLEALMSSASEAGVELRVIVVDSSTDDRTEKLLRRRFPHVTVIKVSSDKYWAESMRIGWEAVQDSSHDYLMWLNDDVVLEHSALRVLIETSMSGGKPSIAVGATRAFSSGPMTYGGKKSGPWYAPLHGPRLEPSSVPQEIVIIEGNVVLVPRHIDEDLGGFPAQYRHNMADTAYSLRARKRGHKARLCPGYVGTCPPNPAVEIWRDSSKPPQVRWAQLNSPKGRPFGPWFRLCREIGGLTWPAYLFSGHLRVLSGFLTFPARQFLRRLQPSVNQSPLRGDSHLDLP